MEAGSRTVISVFEYNAVHRPEDVWALRPNNDDDLTAGFESITYRACMNAVNHAVQWLQQVLPPSTGLGRYDAFAYQGPSDLRIVLLCLAAAKLDKQIMLPSRTASADAQLYLVQAVGCSALIHARGTDPAFDVVKVGIEEIVAPELSEWLSAPGPSSQAPYAKPWAEAQDDPWILLHTSGTTGLPKIVCYTQKMMTQFDAAALMNESPTPRVFSSQGRWFTTIPLFHFVGLCIPLQFAPICGSISIAPPVNKGPPIFSPKQLIDLINYAEPYGLILPPSDIEKLTTTPDGWAALKKVRCVNFIGAQLKKSIGDSLVENGNKVIYGLGTTEAGAYPQLIRDDNEWDWFTFPEAAGATFERYSSDDDVYELVFYKQPGLERFQQVFLAFPDLDVFRTKDLYYKHPRLKNTWKIAGRSDDYLKMTSGFGILATPVEEKVFEKAQHLVSSVMVTGAGRDRPCLTITSKTDIPAKSLIDEIWPIVDDINQTLGALGRIDRDLILVADPARPFKFTGKGGVSRRNTMLLYEKDIEDLYNKQNS